MDGSMNRVLVDTQALKSQSGAVKTALSDLTERFEALENQVLNSANYWTGQAGDAHRQLYTAHKSEVEEIIARYQEHVNELLTMAGVYEEAENTAVSIADELGIIDLD